MNVCQFFITCKRTNNANNTTHCVKLGKKRRKSSKRNYYIFSPSVKTEAIIVTHYDSFKKNLLMAQDSVQETFKVCLRSSENMVSPKQFGLSPVGTCRNE